MRCNTSKLIGLLLSILLWIAQSSCATAGSLELYGAKTKADLELLNSWGFTRIILENDTLFREANELGMDCVQANWWSPETSWEKILRQARSASQADNLVSINMMDEPVHNDPIKHSPELYQGLRSQLREAGITAPLSLTIYGPKPEWTVEENERFTGYIAAIDHLRIDPYPVVGKRPLRTVFDWATSAKRFISETGRDIPLTVILQAWSLEDDPNGVPQLPTIPQLRNMAYQAYFSGAETISFFNFDLGVWNRVSGFTEGFKRIAREIRALQSTYTSFSATIDDAGILRVRTPESTDPEYDINTNETNSAGLAPLEIKLLK